MAFENGPPLEAARTIGQLQGDYYFGDGLGVNCSLQVEAAGTFTFRWNGCLGTYDSNAGRVRIENGYLVLDPERPNDRGGFQGTPTVFLPVAWGPRTYLVAKEKIPDFCNAVNRGREPRETAHGFFYLRRDDWNEAVQGGPHLPERWQSFLLQSPLRGIVLASVEPGKATVNLGRKDGVWPGMVLTARGNDRGLWCQLEVESVEENYCVAHSRYPGDTFGVGDVVASRFDDESANGSSPEQTHGSIEILMNQGAVVPLEASQERPTGTESD